MFRFGRFELRPAAEELRKNGTVIHLPHQPLRILTLLVTRAGEIVTREEIRAAVWGEETFVDYEQGINTAVRQIRFALNDTAEAPRFLQTVPRRGYRFVAAVERIVPGELLATFEAALVQPRPLPQPEPQPQAQSIFVKPPFAAPVATLRRVRRRDVGGVLAALLVAFFAYAMVKTRDQPGLDVAVLPFRVVGTMPANLDSRSFAEELMTHVTQLRPEVISVGAPREAELLIEGTLQVTNGNVRALVRGIDARTQAQLWAESYERTYPTEVALRITRLLAQKHLPAPRLEPLVRTRVSRRALDLYKQARTERNRPRAQRNLDRALALFREALRIEPEFAEAWSGIGDIHAERNEFAQARAALARAIALDPHCAEAQNDLGLLLMQHDRAYGAAEDALQRAIRADPEYLDARFNLAVLSAAMGQHEQAIAEMRKVRQLAPLQYVPSTALAVLYFHARRYDEAEAEYRACLLMQHNVNVARWGLQSIAIARDPRVGKSERFIELEKELVAAWRAGRIDEYVLATYYAQRRDADRAFQFLDAAIARHASLAVYLFVDPRFDSVRNDPRFAARLKTMRFGS